MEDWNPRLVSPNTALKLVAEPRRRYALYHLFDASDGIPLNLLALRIAAWEEKVPPDDVGVKTQDRVAVSLLHTHLPPLEASHVVTYDRETGDVSLGAGADDILPLLRFLLGADDCDVGDIDLP